MDKLVSRLAIRAETKIVLVVMDGLGGLSTAERGSELEEAATPNLDRLAQEGSSGLLTIVAPGVTPGSGAGHLALFGYDPLVYELGRGALSAAGNEFDLKPGDVAARVNFCTLDPSGTIVDRRAGRLSSEENRRLCSRIKEELSIETGVEFFLETERDHRGLLVLRGEGLSPQISDTDPQIPGVAPRDPRALDPRAAPTVGLLRHILGQIRSILAGEQANFILLRGFDTLRELPSFGARFGLRALGITVYPMYRGLARILGMETAPPQASFEEQVETLKARRDAYDFFFLHHKPTDAAGEDGDFGAKMAAIEQVDALIPRITELKPEVLCVTGDHATPSQLRSHSWHPVPFVLWGPAVGVDGVDRFHEGAARAGAFGLQSGKDLMALMLGAGGRLARYGP